LSDKFPLPRIDDILFRLKNAPNSFQRMRTIAFPGLEPSQAFIYMDDLVVIGCSEKHVLKNLTDVFEKRRLHNIPKNFHFSRMKSLF